VKILNIDEPRKNLRNVSVGEGVKIFDFVNAYDCSINDGSKVGAFVEIQGGAKIGKNCKISSHSFVCEGVEIEDNVFIGHNVSFINDPLPRATNPDGTPQGPADWEVVKTIVKRGASIGTGAVILCGITIGEGSMVGAGSVVTKNVRAGATVAGNPARELKKK
jgi:UDP-2-acetamido-3-amino-2,3-dideoxy-glucuronate N-acetyltransferase